jgi:hypothetical protein
VSFKFSRHYTIEEARAMLPQVRKWLDQIVTLQDNLSAFDTRLRSLASTGMDVGGDTVNASVKARAEFHALLQEFRSREIQIKDLERGLVDFPALREGREVFLCWEKGENEIEFWHDLDSGFPGREPLY